MGKQHLPGAVLFCISYQYYENNIGEVNNFEPAPERKIEAS
jgi:hypothetical protein